MMKLKSSASDFAFKYAAETIHRKTERATIMADSKPRFLIKPVLFRACHPELL
jgi:hypothetical protein